MGVAMGTRPRTESARLWSLARTTSARRRGLGVALRIALVVTTVGIAVGLGPLLSPASLGSTTLPVASPATSTPTVITRRISTAGGPDDPCTSLLWVGARGSGQDYAGRGMGSEVNSAFVRYVNRLLVKTPAGRRRVVGYHSLRYPAHPVDFLWSGKHKRWRYFDGLSQGQLAAINFLKARHAACPDERIIIAGMSQGAMVMHRAIWWLNRPQFASIQQRVLGALLIGDGDRWHDSGAHQYGTRTSTSQVFDRGIALVLDVKMDGDYFPAKRRRLPDWIRSKVHSVCNEDDLVCDTLRSLDLTRNAARGLFAPLGWRELIALGSTLAAAKRGGEIHSTSYTDSGFRGLKNAVEPLVTRTIKKVPAPPLSEHHTAQLVNELNTARSYARWCGTEFFPARREPVVLEPRLTRAAQTYADRMASEDFFGHSSPDGDGPTERAAAEGYPHPVREDIAAGDDSAAEVVDAWLSSPGHCSTIMTIIDDIGVGWAFKATSTYGHYWVLDAHCTC